MPRIRGAPQWPLRVPSQATCRTASGSEGESMRRHITAVTDDAARLRGLRAFRVEPTVAPRVEVRARACDGTSRLSTMTRRVSVASVPSVSSQLPHREWK